MREIEFVPQWYTATQRRRRLLKVQMYCTAVMALALATWALAAAQSIEAGRGNLQTRAAELQLTGNRVRERSVQEQLRSQLQAQERVDSSLGMNVEASRILQLIEQSLPREASLVELSLDTEERTVTLAERAAAIKGAGPAREMDRRLIVGFKGVAPTHGDVATFFEALDRTGFCRDLRLEYARDRADSSHLMREFAGRFTIDLNVQQGDKK